jgi:hypothetical protein
MATATIGRSGRNAEHRFYSGMAIAILAVVVLGFARSFFLRPFFPEYQSSTPPEGFFYAVHGVLFAVWVALLVVQSGLVATRRVAVHRRLGWVGVGLAVLMVGAGVAAARMAALRPTGFMAIPVPAAEFVLIPLADMVLFPLFVALAVLKRRDAQAHKRFMLAASINLLGAAVARIPFLPPGNPLVFFGVTDLFFVAMVVWDLSSLGRLHRATIAGALITIASQPLRIILSGTEAWAAFARWFLS